MKTGKIIIRSVAFLLVLAVAICLVPGRLFGVDSVANYLRAKGYYTERKGSLDAVFVGASNVHQFWQPAVAWQEKGIAVCNLSFSSLPIAGFPYLITEARKTQPDALYIINLSTFKSKKLLDKLENYHTVVDYMPLTLEKVRFVRDIGRRSGFTFGQQLELLFPFIRFHSRWSSLESWSYGARPQRYKNSSTGIYYGHKVTDVTDQYALYNARVEPEGGALEVFGELLDYLDREHVNALFVKVPQAAREEYQGHLNVLEDMLTARGYPCLDLLEEYEAYGINTHRDFYNYNHTNVRGALKMTRYMADYLIDNYHFSDKRGQKEYADWDEAAAGYDRMIDSWILPFERQTILWQGMSAPTLQKPAVDPQTVHLAWSPSDAADGYEIYRKSSRENGGKWVLAATVSGDTLSYDDVGLARNTRYTYAVAPFANVSGQRAYGNYSIEGVSCRTPKQRAAGAEGDNPGGDGN